MSLNPPLVTSYDRVATEYTAQIANKLAGSAYGTLALTRNAPMRHIPSQRVASFGTSIFGEMRILAQRHQAINLGQGFPDFPGPELIKAAASAAKVIARFCFAKQHATLEAAGERLLRVRALAETLPAAGKSC